MKAVVLTLPNGTRLHLPWCFNELADIRWVPSSKMRSGGEMDTNKADREGLAARRARLASADRPGLGGARGVTRSLWPQCFCKGVIVVVAA